MRNSSTKPLKNYAKILRELFYSILLSGVPYTPSLDSLQVEGQPRGRVGPFGGTCLRLLALEA